MLVLDRKEGEQIIIDGDIVIEIITTQTNRVKIGITAPASKHIHRTECIKKTEKATT